jgi:hypothetical protein
MLIPQVTEKVLTGELPKMSPGLAAEEFLREQPMLYQAAKQLAPNEDAFAWVLIGMTFVYRSLKLQMEDQTD